jgi:ABC-type branched-subunit amino acid transport system ATPase component
MATTSLEPAQEVPSEDDRVLLDVRGVSKSFGGVRAVADVSVEVRRGETVGIIGPNGAGKTTLFELIGGFTPLDAGTVIFDGVDVTKRAPEARARLGLVRSFQDARLFPTLTVRETLQLASERLDPTGFWPGLSGWPTALERERRTAARADELLLLMGLREYADATIGELSTGTRRITELASLVAMRPRLVLLDEPSSGVAQRETEALGGLLGRLKAALDTTFVIIEHDMPLLLSISDRIIAMETGSVLTSGAPDEVIHHPDVIASYLGTDRRAMERSGAGATKLHAGNGRLVAPQAPTPAGPRSTT